MSPRLLALLFALALCVPAVVRAAPACPQPLRIGFVDSASPPGLLGQGAAFADPPGWEVLVVREALRRLGCPGELLRLPPRRLSFALAQDRLEFALLYGVTPERLQAFRFPLDAAGRPDVAWAPVFGHLALFGPAGSQPDPGWNGQQLPAGFRVGVMAGSVHEALAQQRGWPLVPIRHSEASLAMLQARRFDLLLASSEALSPEQRAALVQWSPVAAHLPYFAPASPGMAQRHPAWTRSFWSELCHATRRLVPEVRPADCGTVPGPAR